MKSTLKISLLSTGLLVLTITFARAQNDTTKLVQGFTVAQSMATTDQQALPAQFNFTFPKNKGASFLINLGAEYDIPTKLETGILAVTAEYHRNSMTDSVQNNLQIGFSLNQRLLNINHQKFLLFLVTDPKWSWDDVAKTNSAEANVLLTPKFRVGGKVNVGKPSYLDSNAHTFYVSLYGGTQLQQVFPSDTTQPKGFIVRPLVKGLFSYAWNRHKDHSSQFDKSNPMFKVFFDYAQRKVVSNSTSNGENFSHLLNTGVNYYFPMKKVKVSFGLSFVEGSDYFSGLKSQQYFLTSFNLSM